MGFKEEVSADRDGQCIVLGFWQRNAGEVKNNASRGFEGVRAEICLNPLTSHLLPLYEALVWAYGRVYLQSSVGV